MPHIAAVEAYKQAGLIRVLPQQWLDGSAKLEPAPEAHESTIESERSAPAESRRLTPGGSPAEVSQEQLRIRKTTGAQAWVKERFAPGNAPISLADILAIHRMVAVAAGAGFQAANALRTSPVQVGRQEVGGIHWGAPAGALGILMEQYIEFIDSDELSSLPPVIHALLAHFFFDTIHPFADGNGRVSRLVAAGILFRHGYNVHGGYGLANYFYHNGTRYHILLHRCWQSRPFDLTAFVAFGIEGFVMELKSIHSFIKMKLDRVVERDRLPSPVRRG